MKSSNKPPMNILTLNKFTDFVNKHRLKFEDKYINKFGFAFSSITRYYQFLLRILERYHAVSNQYIKNVKGLQKSFGEKNEKISKQQSKLFDHNNILNIYVHLEIESFYLFAKIMLDKVTRALEFYFGKERGLSLDSHDDLTKKIKSYSSAKKLIIPEELLLQIATLKNSISDFRDYEIAHEKSPRTFRATTYSNEGKVRLMLNVIYPTEKELEKKTYQRESEPLDELIKKIDQYLDGVINFIENNKEKTSLPIRQSS